VKKTLITFIVVAVVFEVIAQLAIGIDTQGWQWFLEIIVILAILFLVVSGIIGWIREAKRDLPQVQGGTVIRKRHWHFL